MKQSTKNEAEGVVEQLKGKAKELTGILIERPELESEGKREQLAGKIQQKVGELENVLGK